MRGDWRETTIGEICHGIYDGPHATPQKTATGPIFLGISSLQAGRLNLQDAEHLSESDFQTWTRRVTPQSDDVVFSYETRLGEAALIPEGLRCCLGRRMALMRPDRSKIDPRFLLYSFLSPIFQEVIRSRTIPGSTVDRILLTEFPSFPISLPPLAEQRAIAHVLGSLDDKIELNRQMNRTLDELARTLFTSWFVDFDPVRARAEGRQPEGMDAGTAALFPDRFLDSALGPLPEGWEVTSLDDLATFHRASTSPQEHPTERYAHHSIPAFDLGAMPEIVEGAAIKSNKFLVPPDAVLLSKLNPRLPRLWMPLHTQSDAEAIASTEFFVLTARESATRSFIYALLSQTAVGSRLSALATGTSNSHQRVRPADAQRLPIALPSDALIHAFTRYVTPLYDLILANRSESRTLSELREIILPELVSGRLTIAESPQGAGRNYASIPTHL